MVIKMARNINLRMTGKINLKEIERKAWMSYFEDGLWDIFMGLLMLTTGIRSLTDNVWFTLGIFAALLISVIGKKLITIPRIGRVKFGPARKVKQKKLAAVLIVSVLATLALLLLPHSGLALPKISISPINGYLDCGGLRPAGILHGFRAPVRIWLVVCDIRGALGTVRQPHRPNSAHGFRNCHSAHRAGLVDPFPAQVSPTRR